MQEIMQEILPTTIERRTAAKRGRPRDVNIEKAAFDAAMKLYAASGWEGFNLHAISTLSGVGKAALYSRWPKREDLLRDTFNMRWQPLGLIDEGSFERDLFAMIRFTMEQYLGNTGGILLNLQADCRRYPIARKIAARVARSTRETKAKIIQRAVLRGECRSNIDVNLFLTVLTGAMIARISRSNNGLEPLRPSGIEPFAQSLLALLLPTTKAA